MAKRRIMQTMRRASLSAAKESCGMNTEQLTDFMSNSMTQFKNQQEAQLSPRDGAMRLVN